MCSITVRKALYKHLFSSGRKDFRDPAAENICDFEHCRKVWYNACKSLTTRESRWTKESEEKTLMQVILITAFEPFGGKGIRLQRCGEPDPGSFLELNGQRFMWNRPLC